MTLTNQDRTLTITTNEIILTIKPIFHGSTFFGYNVYLKATGSSILMGTYETVAEATTEIENAKYRCFPDGEYKFN